MGGYGKSPWTAFGGLAAGGGPYARPHEVPSDNLYITGLPAGVTSEQVSELFAAHGMVKQCKVMEARPGQSTCVGLVRFASEEEATYVKNTLNGQQLEGSQDVITISFAASKQQDKGPKGYGGGMMGGGGPLVSNDNLYVTGLPAGVDEQAVTDLFGQYGTVVQCKVLANPKASPDPHVDKCAALVRFSSDQEAKSAKEMLNNQVLEGFEQPITVAFAVKKEGPAATQAWGCQAWGPPQTGVGSGGVADSIVKGIESSSVLPGSLPPGSQIDDSQVLYVAGLPVNTEDVHLFRLFSPFGAIAPKGVRAMTNPDGSCKGYGFVNFLEPAAVQAAATVFDGVQLPDGSYMKASVKTPGAAAGGAGKFGMGSR